MALTGHSIELKPVCFADDIRSSLDHVERSDRDIGRAETTPFLMAWGPMIFAVKEPVQFVFEETHIRKLVMTGSVDSIDGRPETVKVVQFSQIPRDEIFSTHTDFDVSVLWKRGDSPYEIRPCHFGATSRRTLPFCHIGHSTRFTPCRTSTSIAFSESKGRKALPRRASRAGFHSRIIQYSGVVQNG